MHIVTYQEFPFPSAVLVNRAVTDRGGDPKQATVMYEDHRKPAVTFTAPVAFNMIRVFNRLVRLPWTVRIPGLHMVHHVAVELHNLDSESQPGMLVYTGTCGGQDVSVTLPRTFIL